MNPLLLTCLILWLLAAAIFGISACVVAARADERMEQIFMEQNNE